MMMLKKLLPYILILSAAFWAGWEWRDRSADLEISQYNNAIKEMALKVSEEASEREKELSNTLAKVDAQNAEIEALSQQEDKIVYKELIKYVEKKDSNSKCIPYDDSDWVQLYNKSRGANMPSDEVSKDR